jgi:hypothetical protein
VAVAKRHHTVPQFYLRGFADEQQIGTVRLPGSARFVQSVRKAASETNFYALEGHEDGSDVVEKLLATIEGEAASVFETLLRGSWPLELEDRFTLAHFITLQAVTVPKHRRTMEYMAAQIARLEIGFGGRAAVKPWFEQKGVWITEEQAELLWQQATRPEGPPIKIPPVIHVDQMVELADALLPYITGRPWSLVRFDRRSLITCDTPVGLVPRRDRAPWEGVGFMTAWGITYPLTRKFGLLLSDPMVTADMVPVHDVRAGSLDTAQLGTTALERLFNRSTVNSASEWLYHHPQDERFVPDELPNPTPVTMSMSGGPAEFSGEPVFKQRDR